MLKKTRLIKFFERRILELEEIPESHKSKLVRVTLELNKRLLQEVIDAPER